MLQVSSTSIHLHLPTSQPPSPSPRAIFRLRHPQPHPFPSRASHFLPLSRPCCALPTLRAAASSVAESSDVVLEDGGFVEIGYISSVHGLQGEVRVKSMTDFQELRFSRPGKRWLRQNFGGKETVRQVELLGGRGQPGQKSWILSFSGVDSVEEAKLLIGSSLLVREEDRPELEDGEFYTRDLIGMKVFLKETGDLVGTVVNVFDNAASDLLQVMLNTSVGAEDMTDEGVFNAGSSGPLVWIPFVEAIVPDVDLDERVMKITPPKGLLELNVRPDGMSKKEKRQLEWKERKKFQRRLIAAKKQLCQLEQQHVFHGFRHGEKDQRDVLADQIVGLNTKLFQQAMRNISEPGSSKSLGLSEFIRDNATSLTRNTLSVTADSIAMGEIEERVDESLLEDGTQSISKGKVAMVLVVNAYTNEGMQFEPASAGSPSGEDTSLSILKSILLDDRRFVKLEDRAMMPIIMICPTNELKSIEELFSEQDYFSFDRDKVWFLEEEKLPVIGPASELACKHKILMKSPWEMLQTSVGSGGVLSLLGANYMLESLSKLEVEYVEVLSVNERYIGGHTELCGFVKSRGGHVGIQISADRMSSEEAYDILFSLEYLKKITKQIDKLHFYMIPATSSHVEKIDKEWIEVSPSSPNAHEFYCSIYSFLSSCSVGEVCVMEITE
uniref:16S rRNA processing protein RimM n=4 Tax=Kalanchoe fedtschenkoi TaxID=63787 RepID=A0A7N1A3Z8_KALFE